MANPKKPQAKSNKKPPVYTKPAAKVSLFDSLNNWADKKSKTLNIIVFACCALFSLLIFQARMDIGGDDSAYLQRAYDFIHKGIFPSFQGPLYPIILSIFVGIFGIKIVLLKALSFIFILVGMYFMYRSFMGRIPSIILYIILLLTATNSFVLMYASLTYNEAFFTALQYLFFFFAFGLIDKMESGTELSIKENYKNWLLTGFFIFCMLATRNIAVSCLLGIILYFAIRKQYKYILYIIGAFLVFEIPLMGIQKFIFHLDGQWNSQGNILLLKNPYDAAEGKETLSGFFGRFFGNSNIYLSKRLFQILGLRSESATELYGPLAFIVVLLSLFSFYRCFKSKNQYMIFICLYTGSILCATFFALQTRWDNPRMIVMYVPLLLLIIIYGLYDALKNAWMGRVLLISVIGVLFIAGLKDTLSKSSKNMPILSKNFQGDVYAGYTTDWVNYLKISQWCEENLPKDAYVAARKAPMSFIYANGKEFFPVYAVSTTDPDSLLDFFKRSKVDYVMLASLRMNPNVADGNIVNTLWRMLGPIAQKYPQKVKLIHQEGTVEPAYIYQITN